MKTRKVRFVVCLVFVAALAIAGAALLTDSGSSAIGGTALAALVGGDITPGCGFGTGVAAGLGIGAVVAAVVPGGQIAAVALGIGSLAVGFITYLACT